MLGKKLSHFSIESRLGEGGMGVVYRAEDRKLGRPVALKVLPPESAGDAERRARFMREARAAAAVNHRNIATIYEIDEAEGVIFIAMELIDGDSLRASLASSRLPRLQVLKLGLQVAEALSVAHRANVIHRDLKPDNVMVDLEGNAKILDFGLAKLLEKPRDRTGSDLDTASAEVTRDGRILGTAAYMSPEQARGVAVDHRSDLFSLGTMLYEMLSGVRPFRGSTSMDALTAIIKEAPAPLTTLDASIPQELEHVILKCLEKSPDDRYQNADDLAIELRKFVAEPTSDRTRMLGTEPRRRRLVPVAGILLVLALGVTVTVMVLRQRPSDTMSAPAQDTEPAVAVLPFRNLSPDPENQYFADGMTEEIISKLSRIDGLEVPSISTMIRYRGTEKDLQQIGQELGVEYLLEGSVRKSGDRARIIAQIVDVNTGFELWSEEFDVELKDIFGVQERTALEIADALDLRLTPQEQQAIELTYTDNPDAYDAFLRGRALVEFFASREKLEGARKNFERALELDPDYPLALVGLARVEAQFHRNIDPHPTRPERAAALVYRALEQEPELAEAHFVLGNIHGIRYDYERAVESFREALRIEPDHPGAWDLLSWALAYMQPPQAVEAEEAARRSIELQPSSIGAYYHLGRALMLQDRHEEAIVAFRQALQLDHTFETATFGLGQVYLAQGRPDAALAEFGKLETSLGSDVVQFSIATAHAVAGDEDRALQHLEKALELGYRDLPALKETRYLDALRSDPRYAALMERYLE